MQLKKALVTATQSSEWQIISNVPLSRVRRLTVDEDKDQRKVRALSKTFPSSSKSFSLPAQTPRP